MHIFGDNIEKLYFIFTIHDLYWRSSEERASIKQETVNKESEY